LGYLKIATGKNLLRCEPGQSAVMMLEVISVKVFLAPLPSMNDTGKAAGIVRLILLGFELAFTE